MYKNDVPLYITKAFQIANKHATNKSLVFNQHGGMEPKMWDKVKETILYLKKKGYRVDGLGWQAHLRSNKPLALDKKQLVYLANLIDRANKHDGDFHVTEMEYQIRDSSNNVKTLQDQEAEKSTVLKNLYSKRKKEDGT